VPATIHLIDAYTEERIGTLVNLSAHGFMLLRDSPIEPNRVLTLMVEGPLPGGQDGSPLVFQACCIWCQRSSFSSEYGAGFEIREISPYDRYRLSQLIGR